MTHRSTPRENALAVFHALADLFMVHEILATHLGVCGHRRCFLAVTLVGANSRHSGNDCPETRKEAAYTSNNNGFRPQGGQGWGQARPSF